MPKVSVIMPCYNNEDFIKEAVLSVIRQSHTDWELIIVDDRSNDETYQIALELMQSDQRIKVLQLEYNSGSPSLPRNKAILNSTGEYISFLDSDDLWLKDKLSSQILFMEKNDISFTYTAYNLVDSSGDYKGVHIPNKNRVCYHDLLTDNIIGCLSVMIKRKALPPSLFKDIGHEDLVFWLNILTEIPYAYCSSLIPLASYRVVDGSRSSDKFNALKKLWHVYFRVENINFGKSIYLIFSFLINYSKKTFKNNILKL
jgi:teichuronic acid biosynthesis glycosyltransferase TuaG